MASTLRKREEKAFEKRHEELDKLNPSFDDEERKSEDRQDAYSDHVPDYPEV